ncbi:hypothetical protein ACFXO9_27905 [Nocardia tengchongensis]|uniref:hypothetical protein n=1 Tax=Nocardia tengchongensis TaxID=2055889 RepID=UPI0036B9EF6D
MTRRSPRRTGRSSLGYLQHADGSWSVVGADGWPTPIDEYRTRLCELEADVSDLKALGLVVIDVQPASTHEIRWNTKGSERRELDR